MHRSTFRRVPPVVTLGALVVVSLGLAACGSRPVAGDSLPTAPVSLAVTPAPTGVLTPDPAPPATLPQCGDITGAMVSAALGIAVSDPTSTSTNATTENCQYAGAAGSGGGVAISYDAYTGGESVWMPEFQALVGRLVDTKPLSGLGSAAVTQAGASKADPNDNAVYAVDVTGLEVSVTSDASLAQEEALITAIFSQ